MELIENNNQIVEDVKKLVEENTELKIQLRNVRDYNQKLTLREALYMSELKQKKNALQKLYQGINTTPHSKNEEYQKIYYGEE